MFGIAQINILGMFSKLQSRSLNVTDNLQKRVPTFNTGHWKSPFKSILCESCIKNEPKKLKVKFGS